MALVLEQIYTDGLAQLSYLVGDDTAGEAAVIDPRRDVDIYLELARSRGVRVTHIVETHIHADFASGALELKARTGATIHGGRSDDYQFELEAMDDGDELHLGAVTLRALHTPRHTPEHISLLIYDRQQGNEPFGVLTGDTLFNLDVGRPDLVGHGSEQRLAAQLCNSVVNKLAPLGDRLEVYPGHASGSACGTSIGDRRQSTIGNERLFSPAFKQMDEEQFVSWLLGSLPEPPRHYARLKRVNAAGATVRGSVPVTPPLSVDEFRHRMRDEGTVVIDARSILAFGGGHIPSSIDIALRSEFPTWVGWMIQPEQTILLVVESERDVSLAAEHLFRLGCDNVAGYLHGGMTTWQNSGFPLEHLGEWTVHELNCRKDEPEITVLDVRTDNEWNEGHVPGAQHIYTPHLEERLNELDRDQMVVVCCGSEYRASVAASVLQRHGFSTVANVPGSWTAWTEARLPEGVRTRP